VSSAIYLGADHMPTSTIEDCACSRHGHDREAEVERLRAAAHKAVDAIDLYLGDWNEREGLTFAASDLRAALAEEAK